MTQVYYGVLTGRGDNVRLRKQFYAKESHAQSAASQFFPGDAQAVELEVVVKRVLPKKEEEYQ